MDLSHEADRHELRAHLGGLYAGRPVLIGPGVLAGFTSAARMVREAGATDVLILATTRGAGAVPDEQVVEIEAPTTTTVTDELRQHDRLLRTLPASVVERIEAFDPERRGVWCTTPFISTDEPVLDRPVTGGRPARFEAIEDKLLAEEIWCAAGVEHAPSRVVPADLAALDEASDELGGDVVWSGDTREGFNGGGNYVRWVATAAERAAAHAFFAAHCDRVRVLPFLEGVPCSIHGMVLPDGTAAFRPVEIAILRNANERTFTYGGLSTYWDPPVADRAAMREAVRRVGEHLRREHDYVGAFGIDGVLTTDGFRPTELNARISAGLASVAAAVDRDLFTLVQANLIAGRDPRVTVAELETALPVMDRVRTGRPVAVSERGQLQVAEGYPLAWDGHRFTRSPEDTGTVLSIGDTPAGFFAKIDPCAVLRPGDRLAPLNAALYAFLDEEYAAGFGPVSPAPSVRR